MQHKEQALPKEKQVKLNDLPLQADHVRQEDVYHAEEDNMQMSIVIPAENYGREVSNEVSSNFKL